jgi:hypothetical protein
MAYLVTYMDLSNAEKDEDDGLAKSAGPVWAWLGGTVGLAVGFGIFWFLLSHR